jgi:hypothetical protein
VLLGTAINRHSTHVFKVLAHCKAGLLVFARPDRRHDGIVAIRHVDRERCDRVGPVALAMHMPHDPLVQLDEGLVAGTAHDGPMKFIV